MSHIVTLNVGGTVFNTSLDTLRTVPDSLLGRMFEEDSQFGPVQTDAAGHVFLDRDPKVFRWILDYLRRRGRSVRLPREELRLLLRDEADYFGLLGLVEACDQVLNQPDVQVQLLANLVASIRQLAESSTANMPSAKSSAASAASSAASMRQLAESSASRMRKIANSSAENMRELTESSAASMDRISDTIAMICRRMPS